MKVVVLFYCFFISFRSAQCALAILDKTTVKEKEPFTIVCDQSRCDGVPANVLGFKLVDINKESLTSSAKPYIAIIDVLSEDNGNLFDVLDTNIPRGRNWMVSFHSNNRSDNRFIINLTVTVQDTKIEDGGKYICSLRYHLGVSAHSCTAHGWLTVGDAPLGTPSKDSAVITRDSGGMSTTKAAPKNQGNFIAAREMQDNIGCYIVAVVVWLTLKTVW
ncbi:unnamed protein product [Lymnaea stagnalis]|uniref:Uncharacterized protein n=1 Tax=Lymnaea stagnalis TaxID=6523 RepID=A0AAV2I0L0_LYMST